MKIVTKVPNGTLFHREYKDTGVGYKNLRTDLSSRIDDVYYTVIKSDSCDIIRPGFILRKLLSGMEKKEEKRE